MANCKYCKKPVGFLRFTHKECDVKFKSGRAEIASIALAALRSSADFSELEKSIEAVSSGSFIGELERKSLLVSAWQKAVDEFLEDGVLDQSEENRLGIYKQHFLLNEIDLNKGGHYSKTIKAGVLRDLAEGKVPERFTLDGGVALNLQKSERIIWAFPGTEYLEDKVRTQYVGRSAGVSIRIMNGVYYRESAFRGQPVSHTERISQGKGLLVLTNKHIYFHNAAKSFRVPYQKIVSFTPYSNGLGIMRDASNAKTQTFINGDGWFIYNIVSNINNI